MNDTFLPLLAPKHDVYSDTFTTLESSNKKKEGVLNLDIPQLIRKNESVTSDRKLYSLRMPNCSSQSSACRDAWAETSSLNEKPMHSPWKIKRKISNVALSKNDEGSAFHTIKKEKVKSDDEVFYPSVSPRTPSPKTPTRKLPTQSFQSAFEVSSHLFNSDSTPPRQNLEGNKFNQTSSSDPETFPSTPPRKTRTLSDLSSCSYDYDGTKVPIAKGIFTFNFIQYPVKILASNGMMNHIWEFATDKEIVIKGKKLNTSQLIIKSPRDYKKSRPGFEFKKAYIFDQELRENILTFQYFSQPSTLQTLEKIGLGISRYYFTPMDREASGIDVKFWIVEKIPYAISTEEWQDKKIRFENLSPESQQLLAKVKKVLTFIWEHRCDLSEKLRLLDFQPGNVRHNAQGELCYIDGGMQWEYDDDSDVGYHAKQCAEIWSDHNPHILKFLSS